MIDILDQVRVSLRADAPLATALGVTDNDGEIKVYKIPAKKNVKPPYVTLQLIPTRGVEAVYGDSEILEEFLIQTTVWHTTHNLAWGIVTPLHIAMLALNPSVSPYKVIGVFRYSSPQPMMEPTSNLYEVVISYTIKTAR